MNNNNGAPFQLLELNVISAQDLEPVGRRKMRTYAVAWVHSERKLTTRIDGQGHNNPTWNDKFIFRVDEEFLYGDTSAVMIEIYAVHWFRDIHVGTVRAIIGNLIPHISLPLNRRQEFSLGTTFVALQVWRPSGRPQGILNIGVALLDSSKRSMPLYLHMGSSAVGYKHLMGEEEMPVSSAKSNSNDNDQQVVVHPLVKPKLRRTKSDSSSVFPLDLGPKTKGSSIINGGSVVNGGGSIVFGFEPENHNGKTNSRGSSMVNYTVGKLNTNKGKSSSVVNGLEDPRKWVKKGKSSSVVNGFEDPGKMAKKGKSSSIVGFEDTGKNGINGQRIGLKTPPGKSPNVLYGGQKKMGGTKVWTDSEIGPSPSEVAAAVAQNMHHNRFDDCESSILGWSLDDQSIEGLRSKLERWRTELPPVYDRGGETSSSVSTAVPASKRSRHARRHTDNGSTFSCFGNICGCEISITCGGGGAAPGRKKGNLHRGPPSSIPDDMSYI
ncbi:hypothetical protein ERO13_D09G228300v2 [Gossypium hirsutum]|uniref:C2 domain-containing protein n=5 Tax=Gossypium TaxID=3633 RepID=A0A1U8LMQ2_GOSHI|nr:uncharacterized protein LOC107929049 [Gossypium hirsutum]KAB2014737.1 hypothetical protein ES319_D09G248100v1 [Gossypium barbadense]TYG55384.1 hypothetical protein ES288_D09G268900v1 [Gossypium darwinii]TYH55855.1 hypothetical protein ES332_D09G265600v1 [Gossypium tomentosum]TYI66857.1 hypothetical protein E1A91_D09G256400v1 [Gossypium mustelinum]KAG4131682.1 hypothetical protein ERO13_D09G228300v2 [Gossypium hirsutum]